MDMTNQDIQKETKNYLVIFGGLLILTGVSLGVHFMHLPVQLSIVIIIGIALTQAAISAAYYMHLISEKKLIFFVLAMAASFFLAMILLISFGHFNVPEGTSHVA